MCVCACVCVCGGGGALMANPLSQTDEDIDPVQYTVENVPGY